MSNKIYVLYHASCADGAGSKYSAWRKFGDSAKYIPVQYGESLPEIEDGSEVYILDFSYSREILEKLHARVSKLVVLDHHETAKQALESLAYAKFDMLKSGAVLAWEYFHPGEPVPLLLQHVQDRDLWKFKLPKTKEVVIGIRSRIEDMSTWDAVVEEEKSGEGTYLYDNLYKEGKPIVDYENALVAKAVSNAVVVPFRGYRVGVVNATTSISEIGSAIYNSQKLNVDFSVTFFVKTNDAKAVLSFRSKGIIDVCEIAKSLGGGGHKDAAGATVDLSFVENLLKGNC